MFHFLQLLVSIAAAKAQTVQAQDVAIAGAQLQPSFLVRHKHFRWQWGFLVTLFWNESDGRLVTRPLWQGGSIFGFARIR
jgi:hypothetical protein